MKVLNYGSLNIDYAYEVPHFVAGGETLSSLQMTRNAGGKGANQSAALAKAGVEVFHAGKIGKDGLFLIDILSRYGVDTGFISVDDGSSGHAIIQKDSRGENAILLYPGSNHRIMEDEICRVLSAFGPGDWLLLQNEISSLGLIISHARTKGMRIFLNAAPFDEGILSLPLDGISMIAVNEIEGAGLAGCSSSDAELVTERLMERFPDTAVLLTLGASGSSLIRDHSVLRQEACRYPVADTTAAGDTFIGYFLASLSYGYGEKEALHYASKAAGIAVSRNGAMESIPWKEEVFTEE